MFEVKMTYQNPLQDHGFWSPSTSGSNFCEEDYQTSFYIAEFINTLSNLAYVYYAFRPPAVILPKTSTSPDQIRQSTNRHKSSTRDFHTPALIAVGLTSFIYHATLQALPQWLDESSMYLLAASFIHSLLTTTYLRTGTHKSENTIKSLPVTLITRQNTRQILLLLVLILSATSYISYATGNQTLHSVTFGVLIALSGLKMFYLTFTYETASQQAKIKKSRFLGLVPVTPTQRVLLISLLRSWGYLNLGFGLWLVDCNPSWCAWLRHVRNDVLVGTGLGYFTELHGWWHFFTARAAGEYIELVRVLTTPTVVEGR